MYIEGLGKRLEIELSQLTKTISARQSSNRTTSGPAKDPVVILTITF
jgi:hypothetical protein